MGGDDSLRDMPRWGESWNGWNQSGGESGGKLGVKGGAFAHGTAVQVEDGVALAAAALSAAGAPSAVVSGLARGAAH